MSTGPIFISHATEDDQFVAKLRDTLENYGLPVWVDSRNLRGGDALAPEIRNAIEEADYVLVVLSPNTINSIWVPQEIEIAQETHKKIIPLLLEGVKPSALRLWFQDEPLAVTISSEGGLTEAMPALLAALGERLPTDPEMRRTIAAEPLEELVLELFDPKIVEKDGTRRAAATAELHYNPASGASPVESRRFAFTAPLGPLEKEELSWYLERYWQWPVGVFKERAAKVEAELQVWGQRVFESFAITSSAAFSAWQHAKGKHRFVVLVDPDPLEGSSQEQEADTREAAAWLLSLPWELAHDGGRYLFQGAQGVSVLRSLTNRKPREVLATNPPIRILLVNPRPEDESTAYFDHRSSALPLVEAIANLGDLATLKVLTPPTFAALDQELQQAQEAGEPYHVVHFDGHGVYNRQIGLGGLCFEHPEDTHEPENRRAEIVDSARFAAVLAGHRIPLFVLDACQTAQAEMNPTASVAAALLNQGVASVVAMSYSVLVATARRFVQAFYGALVLGQRVGAALLAGQRELKNNRWRAKIMGAGDLYLDDWFVPVLFQEHKDPQLITALPSDTAQQLQAKRRKLSLGKLPDPPEHTFIGRSRELLKIERLLADRRYVLLLGEGGEGKTAIAVELAHWLVANEVFQRAAFVSVEEHSDVRTILDTLGGQLVPGYSVAHYSGDLLKEALQPVERALGDHATIIVVDNMESLLPFGSPASLPAEGAGKDAGDPKGIYEPEILQGVLQLCRRLLEVPGTKLIFTSRQVLPAPFDMRGNVVKIGRLLKSEAIELVGSVMAAQGLTPPKSDAGDTPAEINNLVEAVNCHARSLVLLAPELSRLGVKTTTTELRRLMAELHKRYPDNRERSLFASIELSLRRLSPQTREQIMILGVFQGGVHLIVLGQMLQLDADEASVLAAELIDTGLAEDMGYNHLRLHPALCPYLLGELAEAEQEQAARAWAEGMAPLTDYLYEERFKNTQLAASLTLLELPNLLALLEYLQQSASAEIVVNLATKLETLLQELGRPAALVRVAEIRTMAATQLGAWSRARFQAERSSIERMLQSGQWQQALDVAQNSLQACLDAGEEAYDGANYDIAFAYILLGRVLQMDGQSEAALQPLVEAQTRFQAIADQGNASAARMASAAIAERGDCLCTLGRLEQAASAYQEAIQHAEKLGSLRDIAAGKFQLGTVRMLQRCYDDALNAYSSTHEIFEQLGEPGSVAGVWHQIGMVHRRTGNFEVAEDAYRKSLAIRVQQKDQQGEASSLTELGNLYDRMGRLEEAAAFSRQAADIYARIHDLAGEGRCRNNIAAILIKLQRFDEARGELQYALECKKPFGHAALPWTTWMILYDLEQATGNAAAAANARVEAMRAYLAYRRGGGENQNPGARLCALVAQAIQEGDTAEAEDTLASFLTSDAESWLKAVIPALQAILRGSRDAALAENPELYYLDAVELRLLLEELGELQGEEIRKGC